MSDILEGKKLTIETMDLIKIGTFIAASALTWGATQGDIKALKKEVEPVPQMRIDIEVVKAGMVTMSAAMASLADEQRRSTRRRNPE